MRRFGAPGLRSTAAEALRRLGRASARCEVWAVDDDEAMLLLATLNRLQGRDDVLTLSLQPREAITLEKWAKRPFLDRVKETAAVNFSQLL